MSRDPYSGGIVSSTGSRSPRSRSRGLGGGGAGELPTVDRSPSRPYPTSYSARGSPVTRKSGGAGGGGGGGRGPHFVSRSSNSSPIDHHRHHHGGYSSGGGILGGGGGGGPYSNYYYGDDVLSGSPVMMMDDRRGVGGHHRSRSASRSVSGGLGSSVPPPSSRYQSSTMDHEFVPIREPRERSLDRCGRDRSLERGGLYRDTLMMMDEDSMGGGGIGGGIYGRSARQSPNPATGGSLSGGGGILASQDPGVVPGQAAAAVLRHGYIGELQHSNNDLQRELANLKKELELTNQKLGSSMHSIKTFWSPELKKERALRKEESAKYSLINDQLKLLNSENQKQAMLVRQLEEELRLRMRNPSIEMQQQMEALFTENEHLTREIAILRETIKELELRIDTQKQTLQARDESIKKLLEMLQNKGVGKEEERQMFQQMQALAQKQLEEFRSEIQRRDQEILAMSAKMKTLEEQHQDYQRHIAVLKESLCAKEEHYNMLQADVEELRQRLEEKNRHIEKKTQAAMQVQQERNRLNGEVTELRDHMDIKDRKINVLQRKLDLHEANQKLASGASRSNQEADMARKQIEDVRRQLEEQRRQMEENRKQLEEQWKKAEEARRNAEEQGRRAAAAAAGKPGQPQQTQQMQQQIQQQQQQIQQLQNQLQQQQHGFQQQQQQLQQQQQQLQQQRQQLEEKEKAMAEADARLKKRKKELDQQEQQLQKQKQQMLAKGAAAAAAAGGDPGEMGKRLAVLEAENEKAKAEAKQAQAETDRLLQLVQMTQEEQNAKDKAIRDLQEALKNAQAKLKSQQASNAQLEEQRRREEVNSQQSKEEGRNGVVAKNGTGEDHLGDKLRRIEDELRMRDEKISTLESELKEKLCVSDALSDKEDVEVMKITMKERNERIEELEEALRQSVRITAEREMALQNEESRRAAIAEKVSKLEQRLMSLQTAHALRCATCRPLLTRLQDLEQRLSVLLTERWAHLQDLAQMKQEALESAISEKDAHLALLEVSGLRTARQAEQAEKLRADRDRLMKALRKENEQCMRLMQEYAVHEKSQLERNTSNSRSSEVHGLKNSKELSSVTPSSSSTEITLRRQPTDSLMTVLDEDLGYTGSTENKELKEQVNSGSPRCQRDDGLSHSSLASQEKRNLESERNAMDSQNGCYSRSSGEDSDGEEDLV